MTQSQDSDSVADAYKQIVEAELQANKLEQMLDHLDAKMDSILKQAESINDGTNDEPVDEGK